MAAHRAIEWVDFTVPQYGGYRGREIQNRLFDEGKSQKRWPNGNHNHTADKFDVAQGFARKVGEPCSLALDIAPWYKDAPHIRWDRHHEFVYVAGVFVGVGSSIVKPHGYKMRLGINWDMDDELVTDQHFQDWGHIEIVRA